MALVVDASVGLKWVLPEHDSHLAQALAIGEETLLVPDFWLGEATNVLWLQVRRGILTPDEAREGLALLQAQVEPTPTAGLGLHDVALEIGLAVNHSTYDTLYLAFAIAMGARGLVVSDAPFVRDMQRHPDPALAAMLIPLADWARSAL
mgnify:CR=1 FL=1